MALGDSLDRPIDCLDLIISRFLSRPIEVIWLLYERRLVVGDSMELAIASPKERWVRKGMERVLGLDILVLSRCTIMRRKTIPIGTEGARQIEDFGITESLLQTTADGVIVIFRFHNRE